jgi:hypothetical protein
MTTTTTDRGWQFQTPRYKATRDVHPSPKERFRFEMPLASMSDSSCYQYGEQPIKAGQTVETKSWPHESFVALNEAAERVLAFFNSALKSRLGMSPWRDGRIVLDDGLSGRTQPNIKIGATK